MPYKNSLYRLSLEPLIISTETVKQKLKLLISANDTFTLTTKKKGFKLLLVKVKDFTPDKPFSEDWLARCILNPNTNPLVTNTKW